MVDRIAPSLDNDPRAHMRHYNGVDCESTVEHCTLLWRHIQEQNGRSRTRDSSSFSASSDIQDVGALDDVGSRLSDPRDHRLPLVIDGIASGMLPSSIAWCSANIKPNWAKSGDCEL